MTREEARIMLPIIQAFVAGKKIEYYQFGKWVESIGLGFILPTNAENYRIKPEPQKNKTTSL